MTEPQLNRLIQSIFIDQQHLGAELTDCFTSFLRTANVRERDYLKEQEFLLDFDSSEKVTQGMTQHTPIRFPNGNVTMFPSDLFVFFETQSLKDAYPSFISAVGIVHTQASDVRQDHIFERLLKTCERKHTPTFDEFKVKFQHVRDCCTEFVMPFIHKLDAM